MSISLRLRSASASEHCRIIAGGGIEVINLTAHLTAVCMISLLLILLSNLVYAIGQEEPAAAIVNGKRIPMSDLDREMQAAMAGNPELKSRENMDALRKIRREALDYLINRELMIQEGEKAGLGPQDAEIDAEFGKIQQRFASQSAFEEKLEQQELTGEKLRELIKRGLIVRKVLAIKVKPTAKAVTDKDIAEFYEANKDRFAESEKVRAHHILIKVSPDATDREKADAKGKMQAILKEARGEGDFAELAEKHSQCPSASQGGDLGYFGRGQMVKPFEEAAFALQPGQISEIVETQFGYHIMLVQDKKPERQLEIEEVSEEIKEVLTDKELDVALEKWLKPVKDKATVNVLLKG